MTEWRVALLSGFDEAWAYCSFTYLSCGFVVQLYNCQR